MLFNYQRGSFLASMLSWCLSFVGLMSLEILETEKLAHLTSSKQWCRSWCDTANKSVGIYFRMEMRGGSSGVLLSLGQFVIQFQWSLMGHCHQSLPSPTHKRQEWGQCIMFNYLVWRSLCIFKRLFSTYYYCYYFCNHHHHHIFYAELLSDISRSWA